MYLKILLHDSFEITPIKSTDDTTVSALHGVSTGFGVSEFQSLTGSRVVPLVRPERRCLGGHQHAPMRECGCLTTPVVGKSGKVAQGTTLHCRFEDVSSEIRGCVKILFECLHIYGLAHTSDRQIGRHVSRSLDFTMRHWQDGANACGGDDGWIKFAKWKFASFFFSHTSQQDAPPERPWNLDSFHSHPDRLVSGFVHRWMLSILRGPEKWSFLASMLQLKKGCPRADEKLISAGVKKCVKSLTQTRSDPKVFDSWVPYGSGKHRRVLIDKENVKLQLKRTVQELFLGHRYDDEHRYKAVLPSFNATHDSSRSTLGGVTEVLTFLHKNGIKGATDAGRLVTIADSVNSKHKFDRNLFEPSEGIDVDTLGLQRHNKLVYDTIVDHLASRIDQPIKCKPVGLAEPLKIRVITKGCGLTTRILQPLQKFLWRCLKANPSFQLIGRTVNASIIEDVIGPLRTGNKFNSGDYSAATDNLAPWVSECIADEISRCIGLTPVEARLFKKGLTGHVIWDEETQSYKKQLWGQLMGSVVSFPVLCIANFAMSRWALSFSEENLSSGKYLHSRNVPILINGDDIAFQCSDRVYDLWKRMTEFVGLSMSVGKSFFSEEFVQINSRNFVYRPTQLAEFDDIDDYLANLNVHFTESKYVNFGLLKGLKRSEGKVGVDIISDDCDTSLGVRHRELIDSCPSTLRVQVHLAFLKEHKPILDKIRIPYYIPEAWGGVGLRTVVEGGFRKNTWTDKSGKVHYYHRFGPSRRDLECVHYAWDHLEDFNFRKVSPSGIVNVHQAVVKLVSRQFGSVDDSTQRLSDRLYSSLVYEHVFRDSTATVDSGFLLCDTFMTDEFSHVQVPKSPKNDVVSEKFHKRGLICPRQLVVELIKQKDGSYKVAKSKKQSVLRHNEKLWRRLTKNNAYVPPVSTGWLHSATPGDYYYPVLSLA